MLNINWRVNINWHSRNVTDTISFQLFTLCYRETHAITQADNFFLRMRVTIWDTSICVSRRTKIHHCHWNRMGGMRMQKQTVQNHLDLKANFTKKTNWRLNVNWEKKREITPKLGDFKKPKVLQGHLVLLIHVIIKAEMRLYPCWLVKCIFNL